MTGLETLQAAQYVEATGKRFAVVSEPEWQTLIEWLETLEDRQVARSALAELKQEDCDRERAGWLRWEDVRDEL